MDRFNKLKQKKILKELEFIMSDYEFKNELVSEVDTEFIGSVNEYLNGKPELKDLFDKKMNERFEHMNKKNTENNVQEVDTNQIETNLNEEEKEEEVEDKKEEEIVEDTRKEKSLKVKKIYREIVKLTHPDKVKSKKLNNMYIKATEYYDLDDISGLYSICTELDIEYEIDEDDNNSIINKINNLKNKIGFLESTFTWKWYSCKDSEKENLILNYINLQLNSK